MKFFYRIPFEFNLYLEAIFGVEDYSDLNDLNKYSSSRAEGTFHQVCAFTIPKDEIEVCPWGLIKYGTLFPYSFRYAIHVRKCGLEMFRIMLEMFLSPFHMFLLSEESVTYEHMSGRRTIKPHERNKNSFAKL